MKNKSDGYHTFDELYEHRVLLWINLILLQHPKMCYLVDEYMMTFRYAIDEDHN